jgi:hypothetical protein
MKTRLTILLAICAAITLSFTFISAKSPKIDPSVKVESKADSSPVGGFAIEDQL